ncbi:MAG: type II secretion system F family protein [Betaproteobacteria bacterium]|nr:type II secretion system F family protein [Betaproteobacteria bacterium]
MRYAVKAVDARQQVVALELEAANMVGLHEVARQRGYAVLSATPRNRLSVVVPAKAHRFPTALFSVELLALLDAGLNLVEALQTLADRDGGGESARVLSEILRSLHEGIPLSQALERFPGHFPALYVATVRSSERTGDLKEALARYINYQDELDKVRKKIVAASIYPAILLTVGSLVLAFLMFYVIPRFALVYEDISTELPFFSSALLGLGRLLREHGMVAAMLVGGSLVLAAWLLSRKDARTRISNALWSLPVLGERMRIYQLARFYRTLGMLLRAGVPILPAMDMVSGLLAEHLQHQLSRARKSIEEGHSISSALNATTLSTPVTIRMLAVGERSGRMGELLDRAARFHDEETARFVDAFMRAFEPILMAALGLAVGLVVVLMYMPIFELAGSIQ